MDFESEEYIEDEEIDLSALRQLNLRTIPEKVMYSIMDNYFPFCYLSRNGDNLEVEIEEHIYTKYWTHKYHAAVFADAMIKAVKRLYNEGYPFSKARLDNEDEAHLFVRWQLTESSSTSNENLIKNIQLSFDHVFKRANSMLENSDSILILGKDTGSSFELLKKIQNHVEELGFYTYIIKEQPDVLGESIMQKVLRYGLSSRLVIIENTEPSGHLYEFPHIAKFAELTTLVLQKENTGATWMFEDLYQKLNNIKKIEYREDSLLEQIEAGINWGYDYLKQFGSYQQNNLPWFTNQK